MEQVDPKEIIESASCGLALCAIRIDGNKANMHERPAKQILQCPKECHLRGPDDTVYQDTLEFQREEQGAQFIEKAKSYGWQVALKMIPPVASKLQLHVGGGADHDQSRSAYQLAAANAACRMEVHYLPFKSFRIEKRSMQLSEEARADLRAVGNEQQAREFLLQYHSHVSAGLYHLGAIRFVLMGSQSQARKGRRAKTKKSKLGADAGLQLVPVASQIGQAKVGAGFYKESRFADMTKAQKQKTVHRQTVQHIGGVTGAVADSIQEFLKSTEAHPSSWAIINSERTTTKNLVPIWEIVLQSGEKDLKEPAALLRQVWQSSVATLLQEDPELNELFEASVSASTSSLPPSEASNMERISEALEAMAENPEQVYEGFPKIWLSLSHEQRPQLKSIPAFIRIVNLAATGADMQPAWKMLQRLLRFSLQVGDYQEILSNAGVTPGVQSNHRPQLEESQLLMLPETLTNTITTPEELSDKLLEIVSSNGTGSPQPDSALSNTQLHQICNVLKKCISDPRNTSSVAPEISKVISRYGFQSNGETYTSLPSRQVIEAMAEDLNKIAAPALPLVMQLDSTPGRAPIDTSSRKPAHEESGDDNEQVGFKFTYTNHFLTHGPFPQKDRFLNLIDCINHGLPLFQDSNLQNIPEVIRLHDDFWDCDGTDSSELGTTTCMTDDQEEESVYCFEEADVAKALVHLYENSDTPAKIALLRLLLDQRWGVPLVYTPEIKVENSPWLHTMETLYCMVTRIQLEGGMFDLVQDKGLPRVFFLSSHQNTEHEYTAQQITKFRFLPFSRNSTGDDPHHPLPATGIGLISSLHAPEHPLYMQLGMGRCWSSQNQKTRNFTATKYFMPPYYLAIVVSGGYTAKECIEFLNEAADMVILQVQPHELGNKCGLLSHLTTKAVLRWALDPVGASGVDRKNKEVWGSAKYVADEVSRLINLWFIKEYKQYRQMNMEQKGRRDLRSLCMEYFSCKPLMDLRPEGLENSMISQTDFKTLRKQLKLQNSFLIEATARSESLQLKHEKGQRRLKQKECDAQIQKRRELVESVAEIPILQHFLRVLRYRGTAARSACILKLQKFIEESRSHEESQELRPKFLEAYEEGCDQDASWKISRSGEREVGMVHLWRELCHMFLTDPHKYSEFPSLAARHLLDGFPLEVLDGDAKFFRSLWIKEVLQQADRLIRSNLGSSPKILVLSVLGSQSSGKSTLLNVMFGTQLPTKAGRCTRGAHIQLVKSGWPQYDYILLLDTEGIRSPETYGAEQHLSQDNRLATFAILPADACIMVVANEDDRSLKEVLPMVLLAFRGSAAAEKSGGRLRSKLLFVYRSVNINEQCQLWHNQRKLVEDIEEAERQIKRPRLISSASHENKEDDPSTSTENEEQNGRCARLERLFDFRVNVDQDLSDVKFFGNCKKGSTPPEDGPDSRYGEKVLQLRDYLHNRVTENPGWRPFDLRELVSYMDLVWRCIGDADFELSFGDAVQYNTFQELQESLEEPRRLVTRAYGDELEELEKISQDGASQISSLQFQKVEPIIRGQTTRVEDVLQSTRYLKWKAEQCQRWTDFLEQQKTWFNMLLQNYRIGVVMLEKVVNECSQRLYGNIIQLRNAGSSRPFEDMFSEILNFAKDQYEPSAVRVPMNVNVVYKGHKDINDFDIEGDQGASAEQYQDILEEHINKLVGKFVVPSLSDVKSYSDDVVERAIKLTRTYIEKHALFYDADWHRLTAYTHARVKAFVTDKLGEIQRSWDEKHNLAERLKSQKDHFQRVYHTHMSMYDMTEMFLKDLESVLNMDLQSTLQDSLVSKLRSSIEKAPWLFNWRVMRKLMDAFLLKLLMEWEKAVRFGHDDTRRERKAGALLDFVIDDTLHHRIVVEELIKKSIREIADGLLQEFRRKVKHAVTYAYANCGGSGATNTFLLNMAKALKKDMPDCSRLLRSLEQIRNGCYTAHEGQLQLDNIVSGLDSTINDICHKFRQDFLVTEIGIRHIADMVQTVLQENRNEAFRLRCPKACPLCGATCFLPANHTGSHDTQHRPQGFKGTIWESNGQLSEKSCSEHYRDEGSFLLSAEQREEYEHRYRKMRSYRNLKTGKLQLSSLSSIDPPSLALSPRGSYIPYAQFAEVFLWWKTPKILHDSTNPSTCKVWQCIFSRCQAELVKRHPQACANDEVTLPLGEDTATLFYGIVSELPEDLRRFVESTDLSDLPLHDLSIE